MSLLKSPANLNIFVSARALLLLLVLAALPWIAGASIGQQYISLALQGDLHAAKDLFAKVPPESLSEKERKLSEQFNARFIRREKAPDLSEAKPFVRSGSLLRGGPLPEAAARLALTRRPHLESARTAPRTSGGGLHV